MGWFTSTKKREQEARAAADQAAKERAATERKQRQRREDAWRAEHSAAIKVLRDAQRAHAKARQVYDRYAAGREKDAAGQELNAAATRLAQAEQAFKAVDDFSAWSRNR